MKHDHDDTTIGAYLAGELPRTDLEAFEQRLLTCDRCWAEIDAGRRGRALVEQAREPAPQQLRDQVLAATTAPQRQAARQRPRTAGLIAACLALVAVLVAAVVAVRTIGLGPVQPVQIAAAVADYHQQRLPGSGIPDRAGPDLSTLRMIETGAGTGDLAGQPVTGYAYSDDAGQRLQIYLSDQPFPMPAQPHNATHPGGATVTTHRGVAVLCSRTPHTVLVLGDDEHLVWQAGTTLNLT